MKTKIYQSGIDAYFNEIYIENALININETISLFEKLIHNTNLSFNEYINILNKLYSIQINNNDLLKISSYILGSNSSSTILDTNIIYTVTKRTKDNNKFNYTDEKHKIYIKVAYTNNILNTNHKYSIEEITTMVNNKEIVILDFILDEESDDYCNDEIIINNLYPLSNITSNNFSNIKYIRKDYIPAVTTYLNNYFTKNKLKEDFSLYMKVTKEKLITVENYINNVVNGYSNKLEKYNIITKEITKIKEKK